RAWQAVARSTVPHTSPSAGVAVGRRTAGRFALGRRAVSWGRATLADVVSRGLAARGGPPPIFFLDLGQHGLDPRAVLLPLVVEEAQLRHAAHPEHRSERRTQPLRHGAQGAKDRTPASFIHGNLRQHTDANQPEIRRNLDRLDVDGRKIRITRLAPDLDAEVLANGPGHSLLAMRGGCHTVDR